MIYNRLLLLAILTISVVQVRSQTFAQRSIEVRKGEKVILKDTIFIVKADTIIKKGNGKIKVKEDPKKKSDKFYDSLEEKANDHKVTDELFDLVMRDEEEDKKPNPHSVIEKSETKFQTYAGYTIASIHFQSVDLLEGSVIDTTKKATSDLGEFVNKVHVNTRPSIIEKNLLFKIGDKVNPYKMADNERILRQLNTLRDARIYIQPTSKNSKTVDVFVVTQDVTSLGVSGDYTSLKQFRFDVYDINILGYAKQLQLSYFKNANASPHHGYGIKLLEPNLFKSFLRGEMEYTENYMRHRKRIVIGRDFFTPEIKYAGGVDLFRTRELYYFEEYDTLQSLYSKNSADLWVGRSFQFKDRINLIFSTRLYSRNFIDRPYVSIDSNTFFIDRTLLLGTISLTRRNFLTGNRIQGFGKTEDVPVGGAVNITVGNEFNEFNNRTYLELSGNVGKYFPYIGYMNFELGLGSYFSDKRPEDGVFKIAGTYFTNLSKFRNTRFRQFVNLSYTKGINRKIDRSISVDGKWVNDQNFVPLGNERLTFGLETVYFMPWYVYGFQFALFHRVDLNLLSFDQSMFSTEHLFPVLRGGARMLNDNLVLPTFSLEVGYFVKNTNFASTWEIRFSTTLPDLFSNNQIFKPRAISFD